MDECIQEPLLGNGSVNTFPQQRIRTEKCYSNRGTVFSVVRAADLATQRHGKHISEATIPDTTIEELCFLCGPCRDVITGRFRAYSVDGQAAKKRLYMCKLERVIQ
jgi:hypothetical protein